MPFRTDPLSPCFRSAKTKSLKVRKFWTLTCPKDSLFQAPELISSWSKLGPPRHKRPGIEARHSTLIRPAANCCAVSSPRRLAFGPCILLTHTWVRYGVHWYYSIDPRKLELLNFCNSATCIYRHRPRPICDNSTATTLSRIKR